uniref:Uncharacterized protein n=1 Tax=Cereibacter sphaeroides (strain ATCC 17025 / ATH 2.4.3) TaxID=349102 RepID=A4WQG6_CERS5
MANASSALCRRGRQSRHQRHEIETTKVPPRSADQVAVAQGDALVVKHLVQETPDNSPLHLVQRHVGWLFTTHRRRKLTRSQFCHLFRIDGSKKSLKYPDIPLQLVVLIRNVTDDRSMFGGCRRRQQFLNLRPMAARRLLDLPQRIALLKQRHTLHQRVVSVLVVVDGLRAGSAVLHGFGGNRRPGDCSISREEAQTRFEEDLYLTSTAWCFILERFRHAQDGFKLRMT